MGMKKSFANMFGSRAVKQAIRDCIAKTSSWGCSKVRMQAIHKIPEPLPRQTGGAMAVRKRGFDTSQLAAGVIHSEFFTDTYQTNTIGYYSVAAGPCHLPRGLL